MSFKDILRKIFNKRNPPNQPHNPTPLDQSPFAETPQSNSDGAYCETEAQINPIANMPGVIFGVKKIMQSSGNSTSDLSQEASYIIGSGKLVRDIADVAGVCSICQAQSLQMLQEGQVNQQEAQLLSLYDQDSAATCSLCGLNGCSRHIRPMQFPDGQIQTICVNCQEALIRQAKKGRIKRFVSFLLLPLTEDENVNE